MPKVGKVITLRGVPLPDPKLSALKNTLQKVREEKAIGEQEDTEAEILKSELPPYSPDIDAVIQQAKTEQFGISAAYEYHEVQAELDRRWKLYMYGYLPEKFATKKRYDRNLIAFLEYTSYYDDLWPNAIAIGNGTTPLKPLLDTLWLNLSVPLKDRPDNDTITRVLGSQGLASVLDEFGARKPGNVARDKCELNTPPQQCELALGKPFTSPETCYLCGEQILCGEKMATQKIGAKGKPIAGTPISVNWCSEIGRMFECEHLESILEMVKNYLPPLTLKRLEFIKRRYGKDNYRMYLYSILYGYACRHCNQLKSDMRFMKFIEVTFRRLARRQRTSGGGSTSLVTGGEEIVEETGTYKYYVVNRRMITTFLWLSYFSDKYQKSFSPFTKALLRAKYVPGLPAHSSGLSWYTYLTQLVDVKLPDNPIIMGISASLHPAKQYSTYLTKYNNDVRMANIMFLQDNSLRFSQEIKRVSDELFAIVGDTQWPFGKDAQFEDGTVIPAMYKPPQPANTATVPLIPSPCTEDTPEIQGFYMYCLTIGPLIEATFKKLENYSATNINGQMFEQLARVAGDLAGLRFWSIESDLNSETCGPNSGPIEVSSTSSSSSSTFQSPGFKFGPYAGTASVPFGRSSSVESTGSEGFRREESVESTVSEFGGPFGKSASIINRRTAARRLSGFAGYGLPPHPEEAYSSSSSSSSSSGRPAYSSGFGGPLEFGTPKFDPRAEAGSSSVAASVLPSFRGKASSSYPPLKSSGMRENEEGQPLKEATSSKKGSRVAGPSISSSGALFGSSGQGTGFVPQGSAAASVRAAREEAKGSPGVLPSTSFLSSLPLPPQRLPYTPSQSSVAATVRAARQNVASSSGSFFGLPPIAPPSSRALPGKQIVPSGYNPYAFGPSSASSRPQTSAFGSSAIQPLSVLGSSSAIQPLSVFGSSSASSPPPKSVFGSSSASSPPPTSASERPVLPPIKTKKRGGSRTHYRKKRNPNHKSRKPKSKRNKTKKRKN